MKNVTKWLSQVLVIAMCASIMVGCVKPSVTTNKPVESTPVGSKPTEAPNKMVFTGSPTLEGKLERTVRTIFDYSNAHYSNMVNGEVINHRGGWSSYTPHHHAQPEVYYYRYERPEGFGACFIGDNVYKIMDGAVASIPGGKTHPQVTAPASPMYYCWMIRHLDGDPWTGRIVDERYTWIEARMG